MPIIENADPGAVETPLQPLFPQLVDGFLRLSPHSRTTAEEIMKKRQIRFELDGTSNSFLYAAAAMQTADGLAGQRFKVGLKALERTWAATFGYTVLFHWTSERFNAQLRQEPMPHPPAALGWAITALEWAFSERHNEEFLPWPKGVPSPRSPTADEDTMKTANSAAVRVVGWILLHELGHFDRGHFELAGPRKLSPHEEEFDADDWATATATHPMEIDHCQANLAVVPFCLGILAGVNWRQSESHPAVSARLLRIYDHHIVPKTKGNGSLFNTALFATTTPLQALLFLNGIRPDELKTFEDLKNFLPWWEWKMAELGA